MCDYYPHRNAKNRQVLLNKQLFEFLFNGFSYVLYILINKDVLRMHDAC